LLLAKDMVVSPKSMSQSPVRRGAGGGDYPPLRQIEPIGLVYGLDRANLCKLGRNRPGEPWVFVLHSQEDDPMGDTSKMGDANKADGSKIQGEGNYEAARKFDADERAFIKKGDVKGKAREAEEALDSPEGAELERARKETGARGQDQSAR
jgi:hypothetical protein